MSKLYSKMARIYHEFYQSIFDYKKEFKEYDSILKKHRSKKILEVACGSGNLALPFINAGYDYCGLDNSSGMLKLAKQTAPSAHFVKGDMRDIRLKERFDAILITGRSFTAMTANKDVLACLRSVNSHLNKDGILVFNNFDALSIFSDFRPDWEQKVRFGNRSYLRVSKSTPLLDRGWMWNWKATYHISEDGKTKIVKDQMILRAFTEDELKLFLKLTGFKTLKIFREHSAFTFVAKKI